MAPRPIWKGALKISLVTIPVKVYAATDSSEPIRFNQLHSSCTPPTRVTQKRWCATCDREVPTAEIVKGYEFEAGKYVLVLEAELEAVKPDSARVIDLVQFAAASLLPLMAIDRAYYLVPDGAEDSPASRAHALLILALHGKVGIGKLAIYGREYLVAVAPSDRSLLLYTLHHAAELRTAPHTAALDALYTFTRGDAELVLARRVIDALTGPLDLGTFTDEYQVDVRRLIDAKIAGQEIVQPAVPDAPPVVNLREALTRSLDLVSAATKPKVSMDTKAPKRKRAS
jgi:DNA end-binding protein Ku